MYWPDTQTGVDTEPARKPVASAVRKFFTEGGLGQPPTVPGGDWFNQITNEVLNVLEAAGIDPSKADDDQLLRAIQSISNAKGSYEALRRSYADAGYDLLAPPASFKNGATIPSATSVLLDTASGKAYSATGPFPLIVDADTDPLGSGFVDISGMLLRGDLAGESGASNVKFKPSAISAAVTRALSEVLYDSIINVKWFNARGNWDMSTQTGDDDTAAFQAAIDFCVLIGSRRAGGLRGILVPPGHYKYSSIVIPGNIDFGLSIFSDSPGDTYLWADHNVAGEAILCQSEYTRFVNLTLMGALTDQLGSTPASWRSVGFKGKLGSNYADIDVHFVNCQIFYWQTFSAVHGRGAVFDTCEVGFTVKLLEIVADPDTIFIPATKNQTIQTGMRHYTIRNTRFDVVSVIIDITGTGEQKDFINDILICGCDFTLCDILVRAPDAIVRRSTITSCNALYSFKTGVVQVKSAKRIIFTNSNLSKGYDDATGPVDDTDTILSLVRATGYLDGLILSNVIAANIYGNIVQAGSASNDVKISDCHFPAAWTLSGNGNHFVYWSPAICEGLSITDNTFSANVISGQYYAFDPSVQTVTRTTVHGNSAPFPWQDCRLRYTPRILVGGVPTSGVVTSFGRYFVTENFVYADFMVAGNVPESSGNISISLPGVTAVAESLTITGSYAGLGEVGSIIGFSSAGASLLPLKINPDTQEAELWKSVNLTPSRITAAERTNPVAIFGTLKYKR